MENNNYNYEHLFLNDIIKNEKNNTLFYKLDEKLKCLSLNTQKWLIDIELFEIYLKNTDLPITLDNGYEKIYILINELKTHDDLKYHFVCKKESIINGYLLKPLNKFNFSTKTMCLAIPKLTFSFYTYNVKLEQLDKLNIKNIKSFPLELIMKYEIS